ncbi:hypothetical protein OBBRIDRAFT_837680 [Obba rivulosa]|uniref:Uncharacterized protein n=1 Tax=Obba rivulosa TaxID=1052685 RepID=A0A8E2AS01_9APHY|nr:hypothetical protein OBBRIDRAFT_837680 [Obba rivulosa]
MGRWMMCGHWDPLSVTYTGPEWCHIKLEEVTALPSYSGPRYQCPVSNIFRTTPLLGWCTSCTEHIHERQFYFRRLQKLLVRKRSIARANGSLKATTLDGHTSSSMDKTYRTRKEKVTTTELFRLCYEAHNPGRKNSGADDPAPACVQDAACNLTDARHYSIANDLTQKFAFEILPKTSRHRKAESMDAKTSTVRRAPRSSSLAPAKNSDRENWRKRE